MSYTLIADSGATKTDWCIAGENKKNLYFETQGLHPFFRTEEDCLQILQRDTPDLTELNQISAIHFYGAGVKGKKQVDTITNILKNHFKCDIISVYSDMLGAAHATCGNKKGVCCILGTGSNSCYYDGQKIVSQNPSLGYIVGDEASGAYFGKKVLQYFFYNTFDDELKESFVSKYGNNLGDILDNIYTRPQANKYLGHFAKFLLDHRGHYMIENIIEDGIIDFHQKHILKYRESWNNPVHFVGSIAYAFVDVIESLQNHYGIETGVIIPKPIAALADYHKQSKIVEKEQY